MAVVTGCYYGGPHDGMLVFVRMRAKREVLGYPVRLADGRMSDIDPREPGVIIDLPLDKGGCQPMWTRDKYVRRLVERRK